MEVIQPGSRKELDVLLRSQYSNGMTTYFRLSDYPHEIDMEVEFGRGVVLKDSSAKFTVITAGPILKNVMEACEDIDINLLYFHTIKPIDRELISRYRDTRILVIHDAFGLYEAVCEVPGLSVTSHGMPDEFCSWYGKVDDIRTKLQLDPESLKKVILQHIGSMAQ
jgi:transketolase